MKKSFNLFLIILFMFLSVLKSNAAMTFDEALSQSSNTPMIVLIYAQWADNYEGFLQRFRALQNEFGNQYNYVELDIADKDAKSFNSKYHIYPNIPYILMFREKGKISRYIPKECASDYSCMSSKAKIFISQH